MIGHLVSDEEARWQMEERLAVAGMVENRLKKNTPTPLLRQIRSVLRHARPHTQDSPLGRKIDEILAGIPQSDDLVIFDAFSTGEWDLDGRHEDLAEADRSRRELISRGVAAFRAKFCDGRQQVEGLVQLVKDAEQAGIDPGSKSYSFIEELCSEEFVRDFLLYAMKDPHPLLAQMIMVPLRWLRQTDPTRYRSAGVEAATHKNYLLAYPSRNRRRQDAEAFGCLLLGRSPRKTPRERLLTM
jgi:hypothetical protein